MEELARTKLEENVRVWWHCSAPSPIASIPSRCSRRADRSHAWRRRSRCSAHEAEPMIRPLPAVEYSDTGTDPDPPPRPPSCSSAARAALGA